MRYLALGDSISIDDYTGVPGGGAARQFARTIEADEIENLTSDGQTTVGVLADLRLSTFTPDVVTLTAGGNDLLQSVLRLHGGPAAGWHAASRQVLENLRAIAHRLAAFDCPVIVNTIYDPSDRDDAIAGRIGLPGRARSAFDETNEGIRAVALEHGFLLSDLERLFHGHGAEAEETWLTLNIEPNYAGATAIAREWLRLVRGADRPAR